MAEREETEVDITEWSVEAVDDSVVLMLEGPNFLLSLPFGAEDAEDIGDAMFKAARIAAQHEEEESP